MSRVGKQPVEIPSGVTVSCQNGVVAVEGPRGKLTCAVGSGVDISVEDKEVVVASTAGDKQSKANYGTARSHINNMVIGVTKGWKRALQLNGIGYTAELAGDTLSLSLGYSHQVKIPIPKEVSCKVGKTTVDLESHDKQLVGNIAAKIRKACPPEPYLGKGVKYAEEQIRRKAGKAGVT